MLDVPQSCPANISFEYKSSAVRKMAVEMSADVPRELVSQLHHTMNQDLIKDSNLVGVHAHRYLWAAATRPRSCSCLLFIITFECSNFKPCPHNRTSECNALCIAVKIREGVTSTSEYIRHPKVHWIGDQMVTKHLTLVFMDSCKTV